MDKVLISGTGALATLFAARLASAGAQVTLLGTWKDAIDAFNRDGAQLIMPDGSELRVPVCATNDPQQCKNIDIALVLVKSWQTGRVAQQLAQCMPDSGLVVTLQNGLGNNNVLAASLGMNRVALGVTTIGASLLAPGISKLNGEGVISMEAHSRSEEFGSMFRDAGFNVEFVPDPNSLVWGKLVINAAVNPLTALLGVTNGVLLERPAARLILHAIALETAAVALEKGVNLPFLDPIVAVEDVIRRTADNQSSMLQDVIRGVPTEIESICGAVVRAGESVGVTTPENWMMWKLISALRAN